MEMPKRVSRLPKLDPDRAERTNILLSLFGSGSHHEFDVLACDQAILHPDAGIFQTARGISFQLLDKAALPLVSDLDDVESVCDALDIADPLLQFIEQKLHISLDPEQFSAMQAVAEDAVLLYISGQDASVTLVLAKDDERSKYWANLVDNQPIQLVDLPCCVGLELTGPRLVMGDVEGMDRGDLLLLPSQLPACLGGGMVENVVSSVDLQNGMFDLKTGLFMNQASGELEGQEHEMGMENESGSFAGLTVPISIRLPDQHVDAATLSALRPGGNLMLGTVFQGMKVILSVGGKELARGEMVEIGDSFAVHIESRAGLSSVTEPSVFDDVPTQGGQ
jgi:flagellar motor switch/type III secretory pathway protein FliN